MANIALVVQSVPSDVKSHDAFKLAQTIVARKDAVLSGIFFYGDGAYHALLEYAEEDEIEDLNWSQLNTPLCVCVSSMKRRGIKETSFKVVGLGYLAELYQDNDKVMVF